MIWRGLLLSGAALVLVASVFAPREGLAQTGAAGEEVVMRVAPGDRLNLRIHLEPDMTGTYGVDENGDVVLPKLGVVHVAGMEVGALRDSLVRAFGEYLRNPAIEVSVLRRVAVYGEVRTPGLYWVDATMSLRDVIALAGGITEAAHLGKIYILRDGQRFKVEPEGGALPGAVPVLSGDQVEVGRRSWVARNIPWVVSTSLAAIPLLVSLSLNLRN